MPQQNIHPEWYNDAKVYCDGKHIMTIGSTKKELHVDIWSGNHPFMRKYNLKKEEDNEVKQ